MKPEQELDLKLAKPPNGSVLEIKVAFPDSPKVYSYVAVEAAGGWYLTNMKGGGMSWEELIDWFKHKDTNVVSIRRAIEWENL